MTAAAHHPEHPEPSGLESPWAIRDALLPEERDEFGAAFQRALDVAKQTRNPGLIFETLENWRRIAQQTLVDPAAHRAMLQQAARTMRTGEPPAGAVSPAQVRAFLGR
ncbi:Hypothetical protein AJAP_42635 (plasmid) [Amycolatopsis japonica]|uniref:Uncharacterized protein n=1 Tax=Amycolatopsis japonica TaxID=208439 RepID=A0A075V9U1_9PSEU|nr:Hypothetical protein AJAP_42635 [Amycolatopsis japonica]